VININSEIPFNLTVSDLEKEVFSRKPVYHWDHTGMLESRAFLVNPELMDEIYPPEKRKVFDTACIKDNLADVEIEPREKPLKESTGPWTDGPDEFERTWSVLKRCFVKANWFIPVGVYISKPSERILDALRGHKGEKAATLLSEEGSIIFICPERCGTWMNGLKMSGACAGCNSIEIFMTIFALVSYHEAAHSNMDRYDSDEIKAFYQEPWGKIIEESLANAMALRYFRGKNKMDRKHLSIVLKAVEMQPLEYSACTFWSGIGYLQFWYITSAWSCGGFLFSKLTDESRNQMGLTWDRILDDDWENRFYKRHDLRRQFWLWLGKRILSCVTATM